MVQPLRIAAAQAAPQSSVPSGRDEVAVILQPVSRPELADIRIDSELFAVGRSEPPFAACGEAVAQMSRRHARIFVEQGAVYVADLESKNGTTVNGVAVRGKPQRLYEGDELCFGGELRFRVVLRPRPRPVLRAVGTVSVTLVPEQPELGLEPIAISAFPFLVGKLDERFARYRADNPQQVNYLSRRHAHIFLKDGVPHVEDLGSTNGTFVDGRRLEEHAVPLENGCVLAFGGRHFVYRVEVQRDAEPTLTRVAPAATAAAAGEADKTTFVAAPDSFLDIFCVDAAARRDDEINADTPEPARPAARRRPRWAVFLTELADAFRSDGARRGRGWRWGALAVVVLGVAATFFHYRGAPERELERLMDEGRYAEAAPFAEDLLARRGGDRTLADRAVEAWLLSAVPAWLVRLQAGEFDTADAVLADLRRRAAANAEIQTLAAELGWIADLERFAAARGGMEAPIRPGVDEAPIRALVQRWRDDPRGHQRAFARIVNLVPAFSDPYARALSLLRRLESDEAVYLAALDRLRAALEAERARGDGEAIDRLVQDYTEKYPRLQGLDELAQPYRQAVAADGVR